MKVYLYSYDHSSYPSRPVYAIPYPQYIAPVRYMLNQMPNFHNKYCFSKDEVEFKSMHRLVWTQHVNWTRMTITSIVFNLPNLPFVQGRLLRNATDMGNLIRPYYGDQIADRYAELLKEHLVLAAELVTAAVEEDSKKTDEKEKAWYRNADDIALFWSSINPYLSKEEVREMFYIHLALTKLEAVNMIQKNYKVDIEVFDKIEEQALEMADIISGAIIMQFPYRF